MSLISLFKRLSFVLISIGTHVLQHVPAAAKAAESELKEIVSKNPFTPSKKGDSAGGRSISPLEQKVDQMQAQLYFSDSILQERFFVLISLRGSLLKRFPQ